MRDLESYVTSVGSEGLIAEQMDTFRKRVENKFPGARYAFYYSHEEQQLLAAPPHLVLSAQFSHALDYGTGIFEGMSAMINEKTGVPHVLLLEPRGDRMFDRSLPLRGYHSPVDAAQWNKAICDLVAINGMELFTDPKGGEKPVRAYVRPTIHPAPLAGYGVSLPPDYPIDAAIIAWAWPDYLKPEIYREGAVAAINGKQRLAPVTGKHASNYGASAIDGQDVRDYGDDELIYLAPYLIDEQGSIFWGDPNNIKNKLLFGCLSDGPGEEVFAISNDGKTFVYAPERVNRLGGTVLAYVVNYMAHVVGLETEKRDITLADLRAGKYAAVGMIGNAVKVVPIRQLRLSEGDGSSGEVITLFEKNNLPDPLHRLMEQWDQETRGLVDPSHPSLLTPVDMVSGRRMREKLDAVFFG